MEKKRQISTSYREWQNCNVRMGSKLAEKNRQYDAVSTILHHCEGVMISYEFVKSVLVGRTTSGVLAVRYGEKRKKKKRNRDTPSEGKAPSDPWTRFFYMKISRNEWTFLQFVIRAQKEFAWERKSLFFSSIPISSVSHWTEVQKMFRIRATWTDSQSFGVSSHKKKRQKNKI